MKHWKILFWIVAVSFATNLISAPFFISNLKMSDFIGTFIIGISLIPLYGYAHQVAIGIKEFSILIFSINAILVFIGFYYVALLAASGNLYGILAILVVLICGVIFLYPQFMYAFKSNNLWSKNA
jgi:hypothetical protein